LETRWTKALKVYFPDELELFSEGLGFSALEGVDSEVLDSEVLDSLEPLFDEASLESEDVALGVVVLFFP